MRIASKFAALAGLALSVATVTAGQDIAVTGDVLHASALSRYPGAQALTMDGRVISIFGVPMTGGATPQDAAAKFLALHGADFGVPGLDLRPTRTDTISNGSTVIAYQQYIDGLPVEFGLARIVVHPDGNRVTLASARLAQAPAGGFAPAKMSSADARASVKGRFSYKHLEKWSEPTAAVYAASADGEGLKSGVLAWKFTGENELPKLREKYTFFVDAATGKLIEARDEVLNTDITGKVEAKATPGIKPDTASNPPVPRPLQFIRVIGATTVETDVLGNYLYPNAGSSAVNLTATLANGKWVRVVDQAGTPIQSQTLSVTPPGPGNFLLNNSPAEFTTAQANAFICTTDIHNYFKNRAPSFTALDTQFTANVNINGTCNAYYDGSSINFYRTGGGCFNSAYADVVAHEYGHHIVNRLGLAQNAFGEGYGDTCAVLLYDTHLIGNDICGPGCSFRNIDSANKQYPCSSEIHDCGQVVAGVWRDMRLKMTDKYTSAPALEFTRQVEVDWSLITIGEQNSTNGMWPQSAIEVMTADDDDANLLNGTPNYDEIKYAFNKHGISVPVVKPINFAYPDGLPSTEDANIPVLITADIIDGYEHQVTNSAQVLYRFGSSGPFSAKNMTKGGDGKYTAAIPGVICGTAVEYKLTIDTTENASGYTDPPSGVYTYQVIGAVVLADSFEGTTGFTVSGSVILGSKGKWSQGDPNGTVDANQIPVSPEDDATSGSGVKCFMTGNAAVGGLAEASDIDAGDTILTSPAFSLVGVPNPSISYQRWFYGSDASDANDTLLTELSNDNGTTWTLVEQVGPGGLGGWVFRTFNPLAYKSATATMKVRFRAADKTPDDLVDAAIDDFLVSSADCACPADFDHSGFVDTEDFDAFVIAFEAGSENADFDASGFVDTDDIDAFVVAFQLGC